MLEILLIIVHVYYRLIWRRHAYKIRSLYGNKPGYFLAGFFVSIQTPGYCYHTDCSFFCTHVELQIFISIQHGVFFVWVLNSMLLLPYSMEFFCIHVGLQVTVTIQHGVFLRNFLTFSCFYID